MTTQTTASESTLVKLSLLTPISGEALPITQHKDPAISHGLQGQGYKSISVQYPQKLTRGEIVPG